MKGGGEASRVKCHWPDWICQEKIPIFSYGPSFLGHKYSLNFWFYAEQIVHSPPFFAGHRCQGMPVCM